MVHDLLLVLMHPDGCYQLIGRVGGGFTDQDRRDWLCDLQDWQVGSTHTETNDGVGYRWVWPKHVVEISVLDVISHTTRSQPILTECLDWQAAEGRGMWLAVRKMPGVVLISSKFARRRDDEGIGIDVRLAQVADLVEI
jgi:ATP-dependent DNA ligase